MEPRVCTPPSVRVLWVGADDALFSGVRAALRPQGWSMVACRPGVEVMDCVLRVEVDLMLLDADTNGLPVWELLAELRHWRDTPLILLSRDTRLCIEAFRQGADDFVPKPVDPLELLVRGQALLRRTGRVVSTDVERDRLSVGPLSLQRRERRVLFDEHPLNLTALQFSLLWCLLSHHNALLKKAELHRWVLNKSYSRDDRSIDMHMSRIRKKLASAGMNPDAIQTVRGQGYRLSLSHSPLSYPSGPPRNAHPWGYRVHSS
ncbi:response regulator transcription factor [Marinimicrobium sp. ARAG 43.8]|uniref:response regulator transcription factor n=1 Tax=Marinimicrobium sp. ARAG 43.8 TaxID=3418719 RepID=UPI003CF33294